MSGAAAEPEPVEGAVDDGVAGEFPGLRLRWVVVEGGRGPTPAMLRRRLDEVTRRFRGAHAVALRRRPVPEAYRVFFRQIGLDPDVHRTPAEQVAVERLVRGEHATGDRLLDAIALAVAETGVALVAFDESAVRGGLTLRPAGEGERLPAGEHFHDVLPGRLVLADEDGPVALLFGRLSDRHEPTRRTEIVRLVAIQVPGVPDAHVEEALWLAADALAGEG